MRRVIASGALLLGAALALGACSAPYDPGQRAAAGGPGAGTGAVAGGVAGSGRGAASAVLVGGAAGAAGSAVTMPTAPAQQPQPYSAPQPGYYPPPPPPPPPPSPYRPY